MSRHHPNAVPACGPPRHARRAGSATFSSGLGSLLLILGFAAGAQLIRIGAVPTADPGAVWRTMTGPDLSGRAVSLSWPRWCGSAGP